MNKSPLIDHILARRPWLQESAQCSYGFSVRSAEWPTPTPDIGRRLIAAYLQAEQERPAESRHNDVWRSFVENHYGEMLRLIRGEDSEGLCAYLTGLPRQGAGHGYFQGKPAYEALLAAPERQQERALWLMDHLVSLAEALGVIRLRCPEQGEWQAAPFANLAGLAPQLEAALQMPIGFPPVFDGLFALQPQDSSCHLRSLMPAYALHQLSARFEALAARPASQLKVVEIGAGIGHTAYLAALRGLARYSVIDLPEINVAQGFYLLSTLPPQSVRLYGEAAGPSIEVLPPWAFEDALATGFDVALNIDSFPEIDRQATARYLQQMAAGVRYFFSINQEAPREDPFGGPRESVRGMVAEAGRFQPLLRTPNWLRPGYVDEFFAVRNSG